MDVLAEGGGIYPSVISIHILSRLDGVRQSNKGGVTLSSQIFSSGSSITDTAEITCYQLPGLPLAHQTDI